MSRFVATTTLSAMRPIGSSAERSLERIYAILAREFPQGAGFELAEPVPRKDGSGIDWYTDRDEPLVNLTALGPETAALYRTRLDRLVQSTLASAAALENSGGTTGRITAAALRGAVTFPGDENVWIAEPAAGGESAIVLTAWGYEKHDTIQHSKVGEIVGAAREKLPAGIRERSSGDTLPAVARPHWLSMATLLLWLLPLILAGLIGWLLLPACGLKLPFGKVTFGARASCVLDQPEQAVDQDRLRTRALMAEVSVLQEQLRRHVNSCQPDPLPLPVPEPDAAEEAQQRVENEGGTTDSRMQVTLIWNNRTDLDLFIECPRKQMVGAGSSPSCGGELEIDRNIGGETDKPVEHIIWKGTPPPGRYTIYVRFYPNNRPAPETSFNVVVRKNGETLNYAGSIAGTSKDRKQLKVAEFDVP